MITNLPIRTASASAVREPKQQRSPYAGWARFDPYVDNVGCTIRVVRRPSCLVAPPRACKIKGKDSPVKRQDYDEKDEFFKLKVVLAEEGTVLPAGKHAQSA